MKASSSRVSGRFHGWAWHVGNTVHILQVIGWLPIHLIGDVTLPFLGDVTLPFWLGTWFGIWSTWEGVGLQVAAGAFVIGSYYLAEFSHKRALQVKLAEARVAQAR